MLTPFVNYLKIIYSYTFSGYFCVPSFCKLLKSRNTVAKAFFNHASAHSFSLVHIEQFTV